MNRSAAVEDVGRVGSGAVSRTICTYIAIVSTSALLIANPFAVGLFYSRPGTATYLLVFDFLLVLLIVASVTYLRSSTKMWWRATLGLLLCSPFALVLAELALVFFMLRFPDWWSSGGTTGLYTRDPQRGWSLQQSTTAYQQLPGGASVPYELDEHGRKHIPHWNPALPTIHVFGNSFVFGQGVANDHTALNVLAGRIKQAANVLNYGVPGYGLEQMYLHLAENIDQIRPADTVVFAPISDDLRRNYIHRAHFCGYSIDDRDADGAGFAFPIAIDTGWSFLAPADECGFIETLLLKGPSFPVGKAFAIMREERVLPRLLANADEVFERARETTQRVGADFRAYLVPTAEECVRGHHDLDVRGLTTAHTSLLDACPPALVEAQSLRFDVDYHWNERGNRWFADSLEQSFFEQGVLKE